MKPVDGGVIQVLRDLNKLLRQRAFDEDVVIKDVGSFSPSNDKDDHSDDDNLIRNEMRLKRERGL